jgi:hypothetical protein
MIDVNAMNEERVCTACGTQNFEDAVFCESCGQRFETASIHTLQPQLSEPLRPSPVAPTQYAPPATTREPVNQAAGAVIVGIVLVVVMTVLTFIIIAVMAGILYLSFDYLFLSLCLGPLVGTFISTYYIIDTGSVPLAAVIGGIAAALPFIVFGLAFLRNTPYFLIETVVFVVSGAIGGALAKYRRDQKLLKTRTAR